MFFPLLFCKEGEKNKRPTCKQINNQRNLKEGDFCSRKVAQCCGSLVRAKKKILVLARTKQVVCEDLNAGKWCMWTSARRFVYVLSGH